MSKCEVASCAAGFTVTPNPHGKSFQFDATLYLYIAMRVTECDFSTHAAKSFVILRRSENQVHNEWNFGCAAQRMRQKLCLDAMRHKITKLLSRELRNRIPVCTYPRK
jgi:hypothetical protein